MNREPCERSEPSTQDQCTTLKEFDKTLVILTPCALLVSCKLHFMFHFCKIMGMQAIQGTCGHAPNHIIIFVRKISTCTFW